MNDCYVTYVSVCRFHDILRASLSHRSLEGGKTNWLRYATLLNLLGCLISYLGLPVCPLFSHHANAMPATQVWLPTNLHFCRPATETTSLFKQVYFLLVVFIQYIHDIIMLYHTYIRTQVYNLVHTIMHILHIYIYILVVGYILVKVYVCYAMYYSL
jgi:hypothetical protein